MTVDEVAALPFSVGKGPLRLPQTVIDVSGKEIHVEHVEGPVGVLARNPSASSGHCFDKSKIKSLGWEAKVSLKEGIARTYPWIEEQVKAARERELTSREARATIHCWL